MPSVRELSSLYENFLLSPRPGPEVCPRCLNLNDGYDECYRCSRTPNAIAAMSAVSYSVGGEQLHHALASYKRLTGDVAKRLTIGLAAVLWRFLALHEQCVARTAGVAMFPVVTVVPSSDRSIGERHPLVRIVSELVAPARERYLPLLERSAKEGLGAHEFSDEKFSARRVLDGEPVLLVDDTWTTGANAQSAAGALRAAGAGPVAVAVIGRHVNREWRHNDRHLRGLNGRFVWERCALCAEAVAAL